VVAIDLEIDEGDEHYLLSRCGIGLSAVPALYTLDLLYPIRTGFTT